MGNIDHEGESNLRRTFESMVLDWPHVTRKHMFGYPTYHVAGVLFAILTEEGVALTELPPELRGDIEDEFTVRSFETGEGTETDGVLVRIDAVDDLNRLLPYVQRSYQWVFEGG